MSSTTLQTFDLEAPHSRSSSECQSTRCNRLFKVPLSPLLLLEEFWLCKPTYRKSWARNLLMWSDFTLDPSFKVKQGYPNIKLCLTHLLLVLEVYNEKPTYRKSCTGNLLVWSDLTLGPSFKVKLG